MGRLSTTPGVWVARGIGIWFSLGLVGAVLGVTVDGRDPTPEDLATSPLVLFTGWLGLIILVACLVIAFATWNWGGEPKQPQTPRQPANTEEGYAALFEAADDLERRKAHRRR